MQTILARPFGELLLTAAALRFVAFGAFAILQAQYLRMCPVAAADASRGATAGNDMSAYERCALTRKLRGHAGASRGGRGGGQRPKFAPRSPGCVTSASKP